ncbi:MAG: hypothetical protein ACREAZ_10745 [Nitrososphaera sp.]
MALESREILIDDLDLYSKGLVNALKQEKLSEAKEYLGNIRNALETASQYVEAQLYFEGGSTELSESSVENARTEAERAVLAAKRAAEKEERLEKAAKDALEESKRLKKAAKVAKKESVRAWKAADKAEKAENKAGKEAKRASEHATKANQAARRS